MNRKLGLDLEAGRERREAFHEAPAEHPVAREYVLETAGEHAAEEPVEDPVAEGVAPASGIFRHPDPGTDQHVEPVRHQVPDQPRRLGGGIGAVAIGHHVDIGLDLGEGGGHRMALAAARHRQHLGAGLRGLGGGGVGRAVVADDDPRARERGAEIADERSDRRRLVQAGQHHGDLEPVEPGTVHHRLPILTEFFTLSPYP